MEKIKNILSPGKNKDDEVLYGSGQSHDPVHTGTNAPASGQGSHFSSSRVTEDPVSTTTDPTRVSSATHKPVDSGGVGSIQQGLNPSNSSRMPGSFEDDVGSTSSVKSGVPGASQTESLGASDLPATQGPPDVNKALPREPIAGNDGGLTSSSDPIAGPYSSSNKLDPRVGPDSDGPRDLGSNAVGTAAGSTGRSLPDRTTENNKSTTTSQPSDPSFGGDAALGTGAAGAAAAATRHHKREGEDSSGNDNIGSDSGRSFPLGGTTNTGSGYHTRPTDTAVGSTTAGPHSSNLANEADPRVDNDLDGSSRRVGTVGTSSSGYGSGTGPTADSTHQGSLGRNTATAGASEDLPRGYDEKSWEHEHGSHGHKYKGDPCGPEDAAPGAPHFTTGPHATDTANRLDPHVSSGIGAAGSTTGNVTTGAAGSSSTPPIQSSASDGHHYARDAGIVGAGSTVYESEKDRHTRDLAEGTSTSGYSNPYPPSSTESRTADEPPKSLSSSTSPQSGREGHHYGRDTAVGGTGIAASAEAEKYLGGSQKAKFPGDSSGLSNDRTTGLNDPLLNRKATPESSSHNGGLVAGSAGTGAAGAAGIYEAEKHSDRQYPAAATGATGVRYDQRNVKGEDHTARNTALGAGAGAAGAAGLYEADKHHNAQQPNPATKPPGSTNSGFTHQQPSSTTGPSDLPTSSYENQDLQSQPHTGRDAALGVGAGAVAGGGASRKELEKEQKEHAKQLEKEQKAAHKQEVKEEKKHEKELEKLEKKHEKEVAKEEKKEEKKHHGGLLGLFHRDKPDKELKEDQFARQEGIEDNSGNSHGKEAAAGAGAVAGAAGLAEKDKHETAKEHDRNRLHKDPPPGYVSGPTEYAEPPQKGYASQVTGGTGTTALAQGEPVSRGSHLTGVGNKLDPNVGARGETVPSDGQTDNQGQAIEPRTGLPMDLNKDPSGGAGGIGENTVPGYHGQESGAQSSATGSSGIPTGDEGSFGHFQDHTR